MNNIMIIKVIYKVKLYKNQVDISCVIEYNRIELRIKKDFFRSLNAHTVRLDEPVN